VFWVGIGELDGDPGAMFHVEQYGSMHLYGLVTVIRSLTYPRMPVGTFLFHRDARVRYRLVPPPHRLLYASDSYFSRGLFS
jgi:hypothetical protein